MLDKSPDDLRSEGRSVKTTGGARAHRAVLVSAGRYARPPTMQTTTGGTESSPVMDMLTGPSVASGSGAWRRGQPVNGRIGVYSDRGGQCRDGMVGQAEELVGASTHLQCYGSGGHSDRSGRCGRMPWGAAANKMVLCGSARSVVSMDRSVGASECLLVDEGLL